MSASPSSRSSADSLVVERDGGVAVLTLNRPERLNALDAALIGLLERELAELNEDEATRAVVISGAGQAFCAGVDMDGAEYNPLTSRAFLKRLNRVFDLLEGLPQPSVAALEGSAVAGGLELALACTFRVASAGTRLGLPEVKLGLVAAVGTTYRLPRLVGFGRALEMCLLGDLIQAEEAGKIGLVHQVCVPGGHLEAALALARRLAEGPPVAMSLMKDALYANAGAAGAERLLEILSASVNHATEDKEEGIRAFFEKRPPQFRGL